MRQLGPCRSAAVLLALSAACALLSYARGRAVLASSSIAAPSADGDAPPPSTGAARRPPLVVMDEADYLVHRAYAETYERMFPCAADEVERECLATVAAHLDDGTGRPTSPRRFRVPPDHPYPWWFRTLLRDLPSNGAYGWWHHFSTRATSPRWRSAPSARTAPRSGGGCFGR